MSAKVVEPCAVRLRRALDIRNMRQSDLCEKTKIPKSAISHYLSGSFVPKQDRAFIIAQALGVDPAWLMGYDVPMEKKEEPEEKKNSPDELQLTEGDRELFEVLKLIPADHRRVILDMIRSYANNLNKG